MSILYIYAESVQCLSKPKEDLKLQDCEWPDLGVGSCPQRSKEGIGPAGIGISDGSEPPCGGWVTTSKYMAKVVDQGLLRWLSG